MHYLRLAIQQHTAVHRYF